MDYVLHHDEKRIKMKEKMHIQIFWWNIVSEIGQHFFKK
jgi:hypothetical protein